MASDSDNVDCSARNSSSAHDGLSFGDRVTEDQDAASAIAKDQAVLKALQEFIIPLIYADQISMGPAGKLITALKEFISSVVIHSQPQKKTKVKAILSEDEIALHASAVINDDKDSIISDQLENNEGEIDDCGEDEDAAPDDPGAMESCPLTFEEKLLQALREHVFNRMPNRLLRSERHGSHLQITLVERGAVYAHFESLLQTKLHTPEFRPQHDSYYQRMETDEEVIYRVLYKYVRYSILSHTWLRTAPEVTYNDWNRELMSPSEPGYQKLVNFCKISWQDHGLAFGWMDTVCINKNSSSELDESIRSMYDWYKHAAVCVVYLADTETLESMHSDPWFTRGWTLQELLAPYIIKFYNTNWKRIVETSKNDKFNTKIATQIKLATTISMHELYYIPNAPISRRMELAAKREVTREEDMAYSLMGIFDVSIATAYGEGAERAFSRLLEAILATHANVMDIFNWAGSSGTHHSRDHSLILPVCPQNYIYRSTLAFNGPWIPPMEPLILTHLGLRVPVILMPAISTKDPAFEYSPTGNYSATVDISPIHSGYSYFSYTHHLLDNRISGSDGEKDDVSQLTFAVLSFSSETVDSIVIRKTCFAMALECSEDAGKVSGSGYINVIETTAPIVFDLGKKATVEEHDGHDNEDGYGIKIDELSNHGMQLVSLYL